MRKPRLATAAVVTGAVLFAAVPAYADLPVIDFTTDGILTLLQNAVTSAVNNIGNQITTEVTHMETSVNQLLTQGFTQNANYAKAQIGAQQQIADASNTANALFQISVRDAQIRDEHTLSPDQCAVLDNGGTIVVSSGTSWKVGQAIGDVMNPRGEAGMGTPAYYGEGQSAAAISQVHNARYCSDLDQEAGMCTLSATPNADQRADSLFGTGTYQGQAGVDAAADYARMLIQPIVPAAARVDARHGIDGQEKMIRRGKYDARMSLARQVIDYAVAVQTPSVPLTAAQQAQMQYEGMTPVTNGSWMTATTLEVDRKIGNTAYAAELQNMVPATLLRELVTDLDLSNYLAVQSYRVQLFNASLAAAQLAATEDANAGEFATPMPTPNMASN